tara:strand:- start:394 stop:717 length:324 start_codon:yes stop_codon:yes gene_type:complete
MRSLVVATLLLGVIQTTSDAISKGRTYGKQEKDKIYVTCRLAKRKIVKTQKICIYTGANNTTETVFVDKWEICPNQMKCIYQPNRTVPMIEEMMNSLEETLKKNPKQ